MASTTTSDSEDFESADEDIVVETAKPMLSPSPLSVRPSVSLERSLPVPSLKSNCQKELDRQHERHSGDVKKPTFDEPGVQKIESGSGDLPSKEDSISQIDKPDLSSKKVDAITKDTVPVTVDSEDSATGNDEPPIERRRRQQKQREPKTASASKKLGTKITPSAKTLPDKPTNQSEQSITKQPENTENQTSRPTEADPYAKFRGFSKPPMMQRCSVTGPDGKVVLDNHENKMASHEDKKETRSVTKDDKYTEPTLDPYAKFRGYSEPPLREQCWEDDVDDIDVIDDVAAEPVKDNIAPTNENMAPMFDKLSQATADKSPTGWGGWGNWGVSSLLTSATESVSTLTSHVTSVLESGIGAPNPEELARIDRLEEKLMSEMKPPEERDAGGMFGLSEERDAGGMFGLGQLMTSVTKLVETTGSKVLSGGLDTLETIGKKTMEVLQDGDPGLKKKRALFTDKTVLSQVLRDAKEKAEAEDKETEDQQAKRNVHFETLFDDFQGLVHLEALEMLSKQCDMKLQALLLSLSGGALTALQDKLQRVKDTCQLPDDEDMVEEDEERGDEWRDKLVAAEKGLGVPLATGKLATIMQETCDWLSAHGSSCSVREIHQKAVETLARLTAVSVEQFHKGAEMLLVKDKRSVDAEAEALITITTVLCCQISSAATRFCELLNETKHSATPDDVNSLITNIFLEASNSSSYIQEAFQLLVPVLQVGNTA